MGLNRISQTPHYLCHRRSSIWPCTLDSGDRRHRPNAILHRHPHHHPFDITNCTTKKSFKKQITSLSLSLSLSFLLCRTFRSVFPFQCASSRLSLARSHRISKKKGKQK